MGLITERKISRVSSGRQLMAHAHKHFGADRRRHRREAARQRGHERHAADRRAARAPRHLHGRAAADAEGSRHQPAGRNERRTEQQPDVSQIVLEFTADRHISINKQDVTMAELETQLRGIFEQRKDKTMFIAGAPSLRYGEIVAGHRRGQGRRRRKSRHRHRGHAERSGRPARQERLTRNRIHVETTTATPP